MKKYIYHRLAIGMLLSSLWACEKADTAFRDFLKDGEKVYPGVTDSIEAYPGNYRTALVWRPSPDPSVSRYVIYWNNKQDSITFDASSSNPQDTVRAIIPNLQEYVYSFIIHSYDNKGNRSIPLEINNVKVYGELYQGALLNRAFNELEPYVVHDDGSVTLNFNAPDTINITTEVRYINNNNEGKTLYVGPDENEANLVAYKPGTEVTYKSAFIPERNAIDTFWVSDYSVYPAIYRQVLCDKALFAEVRLANDVNIYEAETSVSKLWDGSEGPQGYPNIFHSDDKSPLPHHFTFDMGRVYDHLAAIEETGRDCCNNPTEFEVWGIADIAGAETSLPGNDNGWSDESISKGWTLLANVVRDDDGVSAYKTNFMENPPPVRYIRIRVKKVSTGDANYSNISELTFWNKE